MVQWAGLFWLEIRGGEEVKKALETAIKSQEVCYKAIMPGIEGREVEKIGRKTVWKDWLIWLLSIRKIHPVNERSWYIFHSVLGRC